MYYKTEKINLYYEKFGSNKKSILILPGWGENRKTFYPIINEFQENFSIYIMDYPGFGNTSLPKEEWHIKDYADIIKSFLWDNHIYNPIIIAHSFGGRITAYLVGKYQIKVNKIILIDVAGIKRRKKLTLFFKEKIYKLLKKASYLFPRIKQEEIRQKLLFHFASKDYTNIPQCMRKTFQNIIKEDLRKYYKKITVETLIIWGEKDTETPLKDGRYLNQKIKNAALIIYKNAGHFSYLNNSYLTIEIIRRFLQ